MKPQAPSTAAPPPKRLPDRLRRQLGLGGLAALAGAVSAGVPGCASPGGPSGLDLAPEAVLPVELLPPAAPRELRAAWVATVANIDWPSRPGLPAAQQRAEAIALLDAAAGLGLNALMLQVRPACDAIYPSALEPWTEFLTGTQGLAPDDGYDPLAFWLAEAHRRGLQLHAWFNPYRARHSAAKSAPVAGHISQRQPALVRRYGDMQWLDPAEPGAMAHTQAVVADVLQRYAIDGVHIDDYFYPYPVATGSGATATEVPFPDDGPWGSYLARTKASGGAPMGRADWRRSQVDGLVQALHQTVQRLRPTARFGISPFGIPQPAARPAGITGFSQYDKLYADVERWLREGWMDYLAPQLYWPIDRPGQAFDALLGAWAGLNPRGLGLWPGLYTSMVGAASKPWPTEELLNQVTLLRQRPAAGGHIHFSLIALAQDRGGLASRLRAGAYAQGALVPAWPLEPAVASAAAPFNAGKAAGGSAAESATATAAQALAPAAPRLVPSPEGAANGLQLLPGSGPGAPVWAWAIWRRAVGAAGSGEGWRFATQPAASSQLSSPGGEVLVVSAVSRTGHESPRRALRLS